MTTNQSISVLRTPAAWLLFGAMVVAVCAFAWALRFDSRGPSVANGAMALLAAGASIGLLAVVAVRAIKRFSSLRQPPPTKLETADGVRCFVLHKQSLLIGRGDCCDIVLPFKRVSTHHCYLRQVGNRWYIEDLHSLNGTAVNDRRVTRTRIRAGDTLLVADRELVFR